jgi:hypothetical protein
MCLGPSPTRRPTPCPGSRIGKPRRARKAAQHPRPRRGTAGCAESMQASGGISGIWAGSWMRPGHASWTRRSRLLDAQISPPSPPCSATLAGILDASGDSFIRARSRRSCTTCSRTCACELLLMSLYAAGISTALSVPFLWDFVLNISYLWQESQECFPVVRHRGFLIFFRRTRAQ